MWCFLVHVFYRWIAYASLHTCSTGISIDNDNDNILFDHNVQIEITIFKSLENEIINCSGHYYCVVFFSTCVLQVDSICKLTHMFHRDFY